MKPAAVLIGSLQIQLCREMPAKFRAHAHHGGECCTGVQPYVERVIALFIVRRITAEKFIGGNALPGFYPLLLDAGRDLLNQFTCAGMRLLRFFVQEKRNRRSPFSLP